MKGRRVTGGLGREGQREGKGKDVAGVDLCSASWARSSDQAEVQV